MKLYNYCLSLLSLATVSLTGCVGEDLTDHHMDNKLYVSSAQVCDDLLLKKGVTELSREISVRTAIPVDKDVEVSVEAVPMLTMDYNLMYKDNALMLDKHFYEIPENKTLIKAGDITGKNIQVNFKNLAELDEDRRYVLPVVITQATNIDLLESDRNVYFVFKGAALINVVANISKIYFPVEWANPESVKSLPIITVEALLRSADWRGGREGDVLNSVFGVEGKFLVRAGDAGWQPNEVQVAFDGGKFPQSTGIAPLLPMGEWIHIAVVYDTHQQKCEYYQNGKKVAEESGLNLKNVNLQKDCFVGKSWDNNRWLAGDISELRVWNKRRTAEEIKGNIYFLDTTQKGATDGLLAYWKFNEGMSGTIKDYSGNGNSLKAKTVNDKDKEVDAEPTWVPVALPEKK